MNIHGKNGVSNRVQRSLDQFHFIEQRILGGLQDVLPYLVLGDVFYRLNIAIDVVPILHGHGVGTHPYNAPVLASIAELDLKWRFRPYGFGPLVQNALKVFRVHRTAPVLAQHLPRIKTRDTPVSRVGIKTDSLRVGHTDAQRRCIADRLKSRFGNFLRSSGWFFPEQVTLDSRQAVSGKMILDEIIMCAMSNGLMCCLIVITRGTQCQNHSIWSGIDDLFYDRNTLPVRQRQVEQDRVNTPPPQSLKGIGEQPDSFDFKSCLPGVCEHLLDQSGIIRVVFDEKHGNFVIVHRPTPKY